MIKIDREVYLASTADRHRLIGTKKWVCPQCHIRGKVNTLAEKSMLFLI